MTEKTGGDANAKQSRSSGRRPPVEFFLAKDDSIPLHEQIYRRLRELITTGAFPNGKRLPSTRALAASLGVSRNSVLTAIGKLVADGWLKPARGSGIYVSYAGRKAGISEGAEVDESKVPFAWGWATDIFPADLWKRLQERHLRRAPNRWLEQGERVGLPQLRKAIANHLAVTRGVDCSPSRVIVTSSIPSGVDLAIAALGMVGRKAWVEDPLAHPPKEMLAAAGLRAIPVPVDRDGFDVGEALRRAPDAGMAIVSPACQGPMGFAMSRERRAALAEWAETNKAWILEMDYNWIGDGVTRTRNPPLAATNPARTIYVESFNNVLFPGLRIGYLVVPEETIDRFRIALGNEGEGSSANQIVLADFIESGYLNEHLRRLAAANLERRAALKEGIARNLLDFFDPYDTAGNYYLARVRDRSEAEALSVSAGLGIVLVGMSAFRFAPSEVAEVSFGFSHFQPGELTKATEAFGKALRRLSW